MVAKELCKSDDDEVDDVSDVITVCPACNTFGAKISNIFLSCYNCNFKYIFNKG